MSKEEFTKMKIYNNKKYKEIWIDTADGQHMSALINSDKGILMYMPGDEGNSFTSRNSDYSGDVDEEVEFLLDNGQPDYYPLSWCLPIEIVEQALEYFKQENKLPSFIIWHEG